MDGFQLAHKLLQKGPQCQGLFYDFKRDNASNPNTLYSMYSLSSF